MSLGAQSFCWLFREHRELDIQLTMLPSSKIESRRPTNNSQPPTTVLIGVLALQGDFDAHRKRLEELGAEVVLVRKPAQLDAIDGLVIPGGESSTFLRLLGKAGGKKL